MKRKRLNRWDQQSKTKLECKFKRYEKWNRLTKYKNQTVGWRKIKTWERFIRQPERIYKLKAKIGRNREETKEINRGFEWINQETSSKFKWFTCESSKIAWWNNQTIWKGNRAIKEGALYRD